MRISATIATALALVAFGTGCTDENLTSVEAPAQTQLAQTASVNGSGASCHAVRGLIEADISGANPIGTIGGDLEGTIATILAPDWLGSTDKFVAGQAIHLRGVQVVEVSGGTVPSLVGTTITWETKSIAVHLPPIRRVKNTINLVDGASGRLVSHGIIDLVALTTSFQYEGVICT